VENYNSTSVSLTDDDMEKLAAVDKNHRIFEVQFNFFLSSLPPLNIERRNRRCWICYLF